MPVVSVVIPTYNRRHLIREAIEGVLNQTYKDFEIIVVDDGSSDGTEEFIQSKYAQKLTYVKQTNQGISGARNRGIQMARGKYIAFLDSDDKWLPEKLEKQIAFMNANPDVYLLCTRFRAYEIGKENELRFGPDDFSNRFLNLLESQNYIPTSTVMLRAECLHAVGYFDTEINCYEDFDLWLRITKRHRFECLNEVLAEYRVHPQNIGKNVSNTHRGLWRVYSKVLRLYGEDIPKKSMIRKKAAAYEYLVGTELLRKKDHKEAFERISSALKTDPQLGSYFTGGKGRGRAFLYIIKTYGVWGMSAFGMLLPQKQKVPGTLEGSRYLVPSDFES